MLLARKIDNPTQVDSENFWFDTIAPPEPEETFDVVKSRKGQGKFRLGPEKKRWGRKSKKQKVIRGALPGEIPGLRRGLLGDTKIES